MKDHGHVTRGWLGVHIQADAEFAIASLEESDRALVATPQDSPAEKAGIKAGDLITELNGKEVKDAPISRRKSRNCFPARKQISR